MIRRVFSLLSFTFLFISTSVSAHHSDVPHFDTTKEINIENAVIVEWRFVNPHSYVYFDVTDSNGETANWRCEMSSATFLGRAGWTQESLLPGQEVNINGSPARREENVCLTKTMVFSDGTEIGPVRGLANGYGESSIEPIEIARPARLGNGLPNFGGAWVTISFGPNSKGGEPPPSLQGAPTWGGYELTEAGHALAEAYDVRFDDPALNCHPINIIEGWNHDQHINHIDQSDDEIRLQYGYVDFVRTIHLNMDEHPENIEPSTGGHSIGRWEGDTLVVDTIGFEQGLLLHQGGVHHSPDMQVIERFSLDIENNELAREYELRDPAYFVGVREGVDYMKMSGNPYTPYNCTDLAGANNQRPE